MIPNTSATSGPLAPVGLQQPDDLDLDLIFQGMIAGITGLPGASIRPRWQPIPGAAPPRPTNWCALAVTATDADTNAVVQHQSAGTGSDLLIRHERLDVLCSLYGPCAVSNATLIRDGLAIAQNREALLSSGIVYVAADRIVRVPDLVNQAWINRADIRLEFRRKITRTYAVLNLLESSGVITSSPGIQTFDTENAA